jgi:hypothetical protein
MIYKEIQIFIEINISQKRRKIKTHLQEKENSQPFSSISLLSNINTLSDIVINNNSSY